VTDNRKATRHPVSLPGKMTIEGAVTACTVMNLSLGGALVAGARKLPMGTKVHISFAIPTVAEPIAIDATVRWADNTGVGLQFEGLRALEVWGLNKFFESLSPSSR
jgi:PilZ domain-containing protein